MGSRWTPDPVPAAAKASQAQPPHWASHCCRRATFSNVAPRLQGVRVSSQVETMRNPASNKTRPTSPRAERGGAGAAASVPPDAGADSCMPAAMLFGRRRAVQRQSAPRELREDLDEPGSIEHQTSKLQIGMIAEIVVLGGSMYDGCWMFRTGGEDKQTPGCCFILQHPLRLPHHTSTGPLGRDVSWGSCAGVLHERGDQRRRAEAGLEFAVRSRNCSRQRR